MLANPKARVQIPRFFSQWFGYERALERATSIPATLRSKLRLESDELVRRIVLDEQRPWSDIFLLTETFIDAEVAASYGDMAVIPAGPARWVPYGSKSERRGILGHGALLNVGSKFADTSPTQRGIMIRSRILCSPPQKTPVELKVNLDQPPASTGKCKTPGYAALLTNPSCSACHLGMDPIGYGLEHYDIRGRFRTFEPAGADCPLDGKGSFIAPNGNKKPFSGPGELGDALADSGGLESCLAERVFAFTQGRPKSPVDTDTLESTKKLAQESGGKLVGLLAAIVASPGFAMRTP